MLTIAFVRGRVASATRAAGCAGWRVGARLAAVIGQGVLGGMRVPTRRGAAGQDSRLRRAGVFCLLASPWPCSPRAAGFRPSRRELLAKARRAAALALLTTALGLFANRARFGIAARASLGFAPAISRRGGVSPDRGRWLWRCTSCCWPCGCCRRHRHQSALVRPALGAGRAAGRAIGLGPRHLGGEIRLAQLAGSSWLVWAPARLRRRGRRAAAGLRDHRPRRRRIVDPGHVACWLLCGRFAWCAVASGRRSRQADAAMELAAMSTSHV